MAYSGGALDLFSVWHKAGWLRLGPGSGICELGAQEVNDDVTDETIWSFVRSFYPESGDDTTLRAELARTGGARCHMSALCGAAGFRYLALDVDVRPGTVRFDLNRDHIDESWRGAFDLTTNQGTMEHVINQLHCLTIMHDVTAPGGTLLFNLPFVGTLNHGFYQYNPKFVAALALANNYQILKMLVSGPVDHGYFGKDHSIFESDYHPQLDRIEGSGNWADVKLFTGGYLVLLRKVNDAEFQIPTDYGPGTFDLLANLP